MQLLRGSPEVMEDHAQGLLLGLALGESAGRDRRGAVQELPVVEQVLVVAEILAAGRVPDPTSLLAAWASLPQTPRPGSISAEAVMLYQSGVPVEDVASAVSRILPDRSGDAPLTSCLPFALACHGSGAAIKRGARRCAAVTHAGPTSQLAAVATALLARDLMVLGLPDCLARVSQAVRTEASRDLLAALRLPEPGEGLPDGDDAISLLAAAVQSLAEGQDWQESMATATSRSAPGDRLPALVGALAGGRCGLGAVPTMGRDLLPPGLEERLCGLAVRLVQIGAAAAAADPVPLGGPAA